MTGATRGSFVLENPTGNDIRYFLKWGAGPWEFKTVSPRHDMMHSYVLDDDGRCLVPRIRFDYIGGDDDITDIQIRLEVYGVTDPWAGKRYVFRYGSDSRTLYLNAK